MVITDEYKIIGLLAAFFIGLWLLSSGLTDLDWMINCYKWNLGQGIPETTQWAFSTHFRLEWWWAYQITVFRIVVGTGILTAFCVLFVQNIRKA